MNSLDIDIILNKAECKVLREKYEREKNERESQSQERQIRKSYLKNLKRQNITFRIVLSLITVLGIVTLIFPNFWNIAISFGIILGLVGFIPFSIWLLFFSNHETLFDKFYDYNK